MERSRAIPADSLFWNLCLGVQLLLVFTALLVEPAPKAQCNTHATHSPLPTSGALRSRSRRYPPPPNLAVHGYAGEAHAV